MNCQEAKVELVAYLDEELDQATRSEVEAHLESCESCRAERDAFAHTLQLVEKLPAAELTPGFKRSFWKNFDGVSARASRAWYRRPLTLAGAGLTAGVLVLVLLLSPGTQPPVAKADAMIASHLAHASSRSISRIAI